MVPQKCDIRSPSLAHKDSTSVSKGPRPLSGEARVVVVVVVGCDTASAHMLLEGSRSSNSANPQMQVRSNLRGFKT